ncbi:L,D-transpeptidase family protein [Thalassoroseus pseudoceratinae]|uniref:L,D-transpeptidase family protein n=1 Tax=Thalassoroseus pseudoceratinae TaxID=2713176 RepID=UPI00141EDC5D|nr:L,D-transpeptidase family protein [Thalassoroseus pseudoceratinae]
MPGLQQANRSRSFASIAIWVTAFASMVFIAAWQFQWLPTSEVETTDAGPKPGFESVNDTEEASQSRHLEDLNLADENALFALQQEPEIPADQIVDTALVPSRPNTSSEPPPFTRTTPAAPVEPRRLAHVDDFQPISSSDAPIRTVSTEEPTKPVSNAIEPKNEIVNKPPAQLPVAMPPGFDAAQPILARVDELLTKGGPQELIAAHKELSKLYWDHPEWRDALQSRVDRTSQTIYFQSQPHFMKPYVVQSGDNLGHIAKLYHVPWSYLAELNQTDPRRIRPGQRLKVIKGPFGAVVDLSRFELTIEHHGFVVKRYRVGIGKDHSTPVGEFTVKNKLENPTYYGPNGVVIDQNDPQNPLGEYWIDLGDSYGIHGTIEPNSIGQAKSAGCVRLDDESIREVFAFLSVGSKVMIRR